MRLNFDKSFVMIIGLEGKPTDDPNDPGGFTIFGLAQRYNPEVNKDTTIEQAKAIYYKQYWEAAGCNEAPYPMDIMLFDGAVNPQKGGNKELLNQHPENWQEFLILRMIRYMNNSKDIYVKGHVFRCLRLFQMVKRDMEAIKKLQDGGY